MDNFEVWSKYLYLYLFLLLSSIRRYDVIVISEGRRPNLSIMEYLLYANQFITLEID